MNVQRSIFASVGIALLFATASFAQQGKRPAMAVLTRGEGLEVKPSSAAQQVARATRSTAATR